MRRSCPTTSAATARTGIARRGTGSSPAGICGVATIRCGACGACPRRRSACSPATSTARTRSSWAAARATSRPGSRGAARGRSRSTTRRPSSPPRASCRRSSGSTSSCCTATPSRSRIPTGCARPDDDSVEFHLPHGELIALLHDSGFEIEELVEVRPPDGSANVYHPSDSLEWAQKWPAEEVWKIGRR